jgi:mannosyltransferase
VNATTQQDSQTAGGAEAAPTAWPTRLTLAATLGALVLGVLRLGRLSLWYDEAYTVGTVDRPLGDALWRITHWEANQSPYYLLMTGWVRLGESETFLRLLSVAFWVATVPLLFVLGRRLVDARVGAVAAVLFALHGFALEWAQQVRAYTMAAFTVTLATLLFVRLVDRPGTGRAVAYALVAALAAYTQFFAVLVVAAHAASLLVLRPDAARRRALVVAGAALGVLLVPLGLYVLTADSDPVGWVRSPSRNQAVDVLHDLTGGGWLQVVAYGVAGVAGLLAVLRVARAEGRSPTTWRCALPLLWLGVPLLVTVATSATVKPLLVSRYLLVVVPALVLVAAIGLCRLDDRRLAAIGVAGLVLVSAVGVAETLQRDPFEDWRGAVQVVADGADAGDDVVVLPGRAVHAVRYYAERHDDADLTLLSPDELDDLDTDQIWVLDRLTQGPSDEGRELLEVGLARSYELVGEQHVANIDIRQYRRR